MAKSRNLKIALILYVIIFFCIWSIFELYLKPQISSFIENDYAVQIISSGIIKNIVWTIPAFFLIGHFNSEMYIKRKEMLFTKVNWLKYIPVFAVFTVYVLVGALLQNGKIAVSDTFKGTDLIIVLFVGITEEMVFRGWLLNSTLNENRKWAAVILNAVLFLMIHFPKWIQEGVWLANITNLGFVGIIILSVVFSWTFIKSRNILVPVLLHMFYDLLVFLFI